MYVRAAERYTRLRSRFLAELRMRFFADAVLANFLDPPNTSLLYRLSSLRVPLDNESAEYISTNRPSGPISWAFCCAILPA